MGTEGGSTGPEPKETKCFKPVEGSDIEICGSGTGDFSIALAAGEAGRYAEECATGCDVKSAIEGLDEYLVAGRAYAVVADPTVDLDLPIEFNTDADTVAGLLAGRRRLLAAPEGYEYRIGSSAGVCNCPGFTDAERVTCPNRPSGTYQIVLVGTEVCAETTTPSSGGGDNTGAIVGGVIGGITGLLVLGALAYFCCKGPQEEQQPWAKPTPAATDREAPAGNLVPVYLPEQYPELGGSAYPQAPATFDVAYSPMAMSAQPMAPPMGMSAPIMQPTLYQSQDPGMMYASQQPSVYPQPAMYSSQQPYGAYGM